MTTDVCVQPSEHVTKAAGRRRPVPSIAAVALAVSILTAGGCGGGSSGSRTDSVPHIVKADGTSGGANDGDASSASTPSRTVVASGYLGVSPSKLSHRVKTGSSLGQIADATPGKSASGLIDAIVAARASKLKKLGLPASTERARLARYRERTTYLVERVKAPPTLERDLRAAAAYLGLTNRELHTQLQEGKTLAQLTEATAAGKTVAGLTKAILSVREERLKVLLSEHQLTKAEENKARAELPALVASELRHKQLQPGKG
jgi:hypothetical protein